MKSARKLSAKVERLSLLSGLVFGLGLFAAKQALAAEYYVATTGSDSNPGTQASPFATRPRGSARRGWRHGLHRRRNLLPQRGFTFSKSGTSDTNRIKYWAVPGEKPVFRLFQSQRLARRVHRQRELAAFQGNRDLQPPSKLRCHRDQ